MKTVAKHFGSQKIATAYASRVRGAGRLMDIGGTTSAQRFNLLRKRTMSDAEALAGDWERVGSALRSAMQSWPVQPAKELS